MADSLQKMTGEISQSAAAKALMAVQALRVRYFAMQTKQRKVLLAGVFVLASLCAGVVWWSGRADWRPLFSGLEAHDLQQVEQQLSTAGIAYQMTPEGDGILVTVEQLEKARMAVAAKGMPGSGRLGFELFDKPNWVGSEFDEKVNYQRSLEGELEHTIGTLSAVRSARVHLTMPKQSLFATEARPATASVVLKLNHASIPREQAQSIRALVAGAVENLHPEQVTLVDADGRSNLNIETQHGESQEEELALEQKLVAILEPLTGTGNVRATVNISYDDASEDRTDEIYDPQQVVPVTTQRSEQSSTQAPRIGGVAGTASNTPGPSRTASPNAGTPPLLTPTGPRPEMPVYPQASTTGEVMREESSSYAVTRHRIHTQHGPGQIRRIVTALVVNDHAVMDASGKQVIWKQRSADEMQRLEMLAQGAVGFDARRGDQVVIQNIPFSANEGETKRSLMERFTGQGSALFRNQPALFRTLGIALCTFLLCFFVLRPLTQHVGKAISTPILLAGEERYDPQLVSTHDASGDLSLFAPQNALAQVTQQIRTDPHQSTKLLESWIGSSVEMD